MMDRNGDPKGIFAFAFAPARRVRLQGRKRSSRPVLLELGESISVYVAVILFAASASPSPSISIAEAQTQPQPQPQPQTQTQTQPQNNTTDATPESESVTMPPSLSVPVSSSTTPPTSNIAQPPVLPVLVPTPTVAHTNAPANAPANAPTYGPTTSVLSPNGFATEPPTSHPTLTPKPTNAPTSAPTLEPSTTPTLSSRPSVLPSLSLRPSVSSSPTGQPSAAPSAQPSWQVPSFKETKFRQPIQVANGRELDKDAIVAFQVIYQIQTIDFSGLPEDVVREKITTECTIDKQQIKKDEIEPERARGERRIYDYHDPYINEPIWLEDEFGNITSSFDHPTQFLQRRRRRRGRTRTRTRTRTLGRTLGRSRRRAQAAPESVTLLVDFTMTYSSSYYNITTYPKEFQTHTNSNLEEMLKQMQDLKINVTEVGKIQRLVVITPAPSLSVSAAPSSTPTGNPTITARPSGLPSLSGTKVPEISGSVKTSVIAISVSILVALAILVTGVFFWYRKRQTNRGLDESKMDVHGQPTTSDPNRNPSDVESNARWNNTTGTGTGTGTGADLNLNTNTNTKFGTPESKAYGSAFGKPSSEAPSGLAGVGVGVGVGGGRGVVSPNGSLHSNPSLVSEGDPFGGDDSVDEADITQNLADELDKFQDHNMEIMRANVEENLAGCDGMMSQAVARALIDDVDHDTSSDIYWGGDIDISAPEIEASALGSVMDWLKRNDKASDREKRDFFQESLNNMTASVRYNVVHPEDGARTIHECAGLLGLQLAVEIPVTTIVISGMRKSTTEDDIRKRFSPFGDISIAAVAPKHKGYGILRFTSDVAVDRVMSRFRTEEIVLDDVAVQLRVIKPGSNTQASEPNSII